MRVTLVDLVSHADYFVEARSKNGGQVSSWSPLFHFVTDKDTIAPGPVTAPAITTVGRAFRVTWTAPTTDAAGNPLADLSHFEVTVSNGVAFGTYKVIGNSFDFNYDMNVSLFGSPRGSLDFSIVAVDRTENKGVATTISGVNTAPPDVTGLVATAGTDEIRLTWNAVSAEDLSNYVIYLNTTNDFATATAVATSVNDSFDYQTSLYTTDHFFWVKAADAFGTQSAGPSNVQGPLRPNSVFIFDSTPPPVATGLVLSPGVSQIAVSWSTPAGSDAIGYQVRYRADTTAPWNYLEAGLPDGTAARPFPVIGGLVGGVTYTVEVQPYDEYFNFGDWLSGTATPIAAPGGSVIGVVGTANPTSISIAWDRVTTASEYEAVLYTDAARTLVDRRVTVTGTTVTLGDATLPLTASTTYYPSVRARVASGVYGAFTNVGGSLGVTTPASGTIAFDHKGGRLNGGLLIENTVRAETLRADSTITHNLNVGNRLTMGDIGTSAGEIVSGNYYDATGAVTGFGYRLTHNSLDLRSGIIHGGLITVGAIRSSATISEGEAGQPAWYINTTGIAEFGDVRVRGRIVVGNGGNTAATNSTISVRSYNYQSGSLGWAISGDGNVEFNSGTFRGNLTVGGTATTPALHVDKASGNLLVGSVSVANGTGNFKVTGSSGAVSIGGTGSLTIGTNFTVDSAGAITATSGKIGGWSIGPSSLASGNMTLSSSNGFQMGTTFSVSSTGYLTAKSGEIAGFTFNSSTLTGGAGSYISGGNIQGANVSVTRAITNGNATIAMGPGHLDGSTGFPALEWTNTVTTWAKWPKVHGTTNALLLSGPSSASSTANAGMVFLTSTSGALYSPNGVIAAWDNNGFNVQAGTLKQGGTAVSLSGHGHTYPVTSVNGRTGAVSGLAESHTHPYAATNGSSSVSFNASEMYTSGRYRSTNQTNGGALIQMTSGNYSKFHWDGTNYRLYVDTTWQKTFIIDHPTPAKKDTHHLIHATLEGPESGVYYRGKACLTEDMAIIKLPPYFVDLVRAGTESVMLTPIWGCEDPTCEGSAPPNMATSLVVNGEFRVHSAGGYHHPCASFFWEVKGERKDVDELVVEPEKIAVDVFGDGPYKYYSMKEAV